MKYKEEQKSRTPVYDGRILRLVRDDVILPNGKDAVREVIIHFGGSAVLCVENKKILMVKQFRYPTGEELYEIPAGKLNKGEDPMSTAFRELEEEAGLKAESMEKIFAFYPTPAYDTEVIHIFYARGLEKSKQNLDEDEFLSVCWIDLDKAYEMTLSGEIKDAKTIIAIQYAMNKSL